MAEPEVLLLFVSTICWHRELYGYPGWPSRRKALSLFNFKDECLRRGVYMVFIRAALFFLVVEIMENMVFLSTASNLVTYLHSSLHYSVAGSANMLTNFMGTSFLLTLLGGFISDSFLTRFWTLLLFGAIELTGLVMLTIQAHYFRHQLTEGRQPSHSQVAMLYIGLYAMAVGVGGVKAALPAHGADQFKSSDKRIVSTFFNWFFFCLCMGGFLAVTILVWVQENLGWRWGFTLSAITLCFALLIFTIGLPFYRHKLPTGSPVTRVLQVFVAAVRNWKVSVPEASVLGLDGKSQGKLRFLDKAAAAGCSSGQVEETKSFIRLLPIFATTITMNCCLAQLQTFSVQQGHTMDRKLINFEIPAASLTAIPLVIMLLSVSLYDRLLVKLVGRRTGKKTGFRPLHRIGVGLVLASMAMGVAAVVEVKRRVASASHGDGGSVFWLSWQYMLLGVSDMFTLAGMMEFFYSEAPHSMRSLCTALSWCSTSMGYFLSSVLVSVANLVSSQLGSEAWLGGDNLNSSRLDLFYAMLCVINFVNFLHYLLWARWY